MAFTGLRVIAKDVAGITKANVCATVCAVLVEDSTSANQIALFQATQEYYAQLHTLHDELQNTFPLLVTLPAPQFSAASGSASAPQNLTIKNVGTKSIPIGNIALVDNNSGFDAGNPVVCDPLPASKELAPNTSCRIQITFRPPPSTPTGLIKTTLNISYGERPFILSIQLTGAATQSSRGPGGAGGGAPGGAGAAPASTGGTGPGAASGGAAPATAPIGFTYLSDILSALGGAKRHQYICPVSLSADDPGICNSDRK